jgi:hypothetical protein
VFICLKPLPSKKIHGTGNSQTECSGTHCLRNTSSLNTYRAFLVVNFLAEVGGYLGLFLGYSFLHISQGFSFFYNTARCGHIKETVSPDITNFLKA